MVGVRKRELARARVVKELDKLEMLLQASEYENEYKDVDLTEFYSSCDGSFKTEKREEVGGRDFEEATS